MEPPAKTDCLAELEKKDLLVLPETQEETEPTGKVDLKVMLVLQVYPESEVDPVFQDKEKGENLADQVYLKGYPDSLETKESQGSQVEMVYQEVLVPKETAVLLDETVKRERVDVMENQEDPD